MKNNAGQKVRDIIRKEFDSRMEMAVVTHILGMGWDKLELVTEEDILKVEGNGLMTKEFCQALVRASVRICKECDMFEYFLPFIVNYLFVPNAKMREVKLYKSDMDNYDWDNILDKFDIYDEEDIDDVYLLILNANVIETVKSS